MANSTNKDKALELIGQHGNSLKELRSKLKVLVDAKSADRLDRKIKACEDAHKALSEDADIIVWGGG
jgi:hypothetical protein